MSESGIPFAFHWRDIAVLLTVLLACVAPICAQEAAEPPDQEADRIVEGRPPLYSFKRDIHPLTWLEAATKPAFRLAQSDWINRIGARATTPQPEKRSGVKFGVEGVGPGSGLGPAVTLFHKDVFGRGIQVEVPLVYTYNRYESYQLRASAPLIEESLLGQLTFDFGTAYQSRASDEFFPIGNDVPLSSESHIRTVSRELQFGVTAKFNDEWKSGLHETYRNVGVTNPLIGSNAQQLFRGLSIPGLLRGAGIRSTILSLDHNNIQQEPFAATGGLQHFEVSLNEDTRTNAFAYWKYRVDLQQVFSLSADHRSAIAVRGFAETVQREGSGDIPWFDMPSLGTWETLRGYENFRFRDKSALSFGVEYRYRIWRAVNWGLFLDEGQVAPRPRDFALNRFHPGYGVRLFCFPKPKFPISIDLAHSQEKWRLYANINTRF